MKSPIANPSTNAPRVSVIIPTYNRRELLPAAIESVLAQTFPAHELIVIDDGSTDNTRESLIPYIDRIRYHRQPNRGVSAARNVGIHLASGEWIAFLDADDRWHPAKIQLQLEALDALGPSFGACCTDCQYSVNSVPTASAFADSCLPVEGQFGAIANPLLYITPSRYAICIQSMIVRRSLLQAIGGFDEFLRIVEDRELVFRLSFRTAIAYVSAPLVDIDRTPHRPRLTQLCSRRDSQTFQWAEHLLNKMLAHPELSDPQIRRMLDDELNSLYYDHASSSINQLAFPSAIKAMHRLSQRGESPSRILSALVSRAAHKFSRALRTSPAEANS